MKAQKITIEQLAAAEELIVKHHLAPTAVDSFTVRVQLDGTKFYVKGNGLDVAGSVKFAETNYSRINDKLGYIAAMVFGSKKITKSKQFISCVAAFEIAKAAQKCGFEFELTYTDHRNLHLF